MGAATEIGELLTAGAVTDVITSRATWFREASWFSARCTAPVVAGQTVWITTPLAAGQVRVVEQPNYFGRFETEIPDGNETVTVQYWGSPRARLSDSIVASQTHVGSLEVARNLAGALKQIRGVTLPHGQPQSPWFIVSLPARPKRVAADLASAGYRGCSLVGAQFPEFPGGMRIEVAWPRSENDQFVTTIRTAMNL